MRYVIRMQTRLSTFSLMLTVGLLGGCASQISAPIRDGNGVQPPAAAVPVPAASQHTVRQGETLLGIARQYGVTLPDLVSWNMLTDPNQIHVGQSLRVTPPDGGAGAVATAIPIAPGGAEMPAAGEGAGAVPLKQGPIGGRQPYSDEAWAKLSPGAAVTPPTPVLPPPQEAVKPTGDGQWRWPASGQVIAGYNEASNKGVDIGGKVGDPVYASAAGKVVYAGSGLRGYGKLVVIKHNQEYNSVYAHNDKLLVKEDDQVTQGQQIAELGNSESDRPKLHFEIRKQGKAVDPMTYLPAR